MRDPIPKPINEVRKEIARLRRPYFSVGEVVEVKGTKFIVHRVNPFGILLKEVKE